ncbi:hypothetical protein [Paracoccus sp. (in: a-proteobacteria)]|uniref:hypothetical protein n=1 Tax=Paracoccus sp. TaxID=267 RepID=UPI0026DF0DAB|nr:hypothetical protein [Paracoccus sp. (in: a-proteobacteria)]MDO5647257.1 hypothetical protein [Paracoccus sp. (in: a-proteobacteria)]
MMRNAVFGWVALMLAGCGCNVNFLDTSGTTSDACTAGMVAAAIVTAPVMLPIGLVQQALDD